VAGDSLDSADIHVATSPCCQMVTSGRGSQAGQHRGGGTAAPLRRGTGDRARIRSECAGPPWL